MRIVIGFTAEAIAYSEERIRVRAARRLIVNPAGAVAICRPSTQKAAFCLLCLAAEIGKPVLAGLHHQVGKGCVDLGLGGRSGDLPLNAPIDHLFGLTLPVARRQAPRKRRVVPDPRVVRFGCIAKVKQLFLQFMRLPNALPRRLLEGGVGTSRSSEWSVLLGILSDGPALLTLPPPSPRKSCATG